jgi:hypothetical protein
MDFIERMFGLSPDGGNGALELQILIAAVVAVAAVLATVAISRRRRR